MSTSTFWILSVGAAIFVLMGWLLPWFVGPFSSGAGFSPMDVVVGNITGVGTFLVYLLAVAMLVVLLSPLYEAWLRRQKVTASARADRIRALVAVAGLVLTL